MKGKWRPIEAPESRSFAPQWAERRLELEMEEVPLYDDLCRLCECTDYSACEGGCWWVEGDLCSSCDKLRAEFPVLMLADGYGIAAWAALVAPGLQLTTEN